MPRISDKTVAVVRLETLYDVYLPKHQQGIPCNTTTSPEVTRSCHRTHLPRRAAHAWQMPSRKHHCAASTRPRRFLRLCSFCHQWFFTVFAVGVSEIDIIRDVPVRENDRDGYRNARRNAWRSVPHRNLDMTVERNIVSSTKFVNLLYLIPKFSIK